MEHCTALIYTQHLALCSPWQVAVGHQWALLAPLLTLLPAFISHHHTITISGDKQQSTMPRLNTNNFFSLKSPCKSIAFVRRSTNTKKPINKPKSNPRIPVRMGTLNNFRFFLGWVVLITWTCRYFQKIYFIMLTALCISANPGTARNLLSAVPVQHRGRGGALPCRPSNGRGKGKCQDLGSNRISRYLHVTT